MKYIAQEDEMGCAIACVANLKDIPYQNARELFDSKHANYRGYYCINIINALKKLNIQSNYRKYNNNVQFISGDIVFFSKCADLPYGHYMLKVSDGWVDSWINLSENPNVRHAQAGIRETTSWNPEWLVRVINN